MMGHHDAINDDDDDEKKRIFTGRIPVDITPNLVSHPVNYRFPFLVVKHLLLLSYEDSYY